MRLSRLDSKLNYCAFIHSLNYWQNRTPYHSLQVDPRNFFPFPLPSESSSFFIDPLQHSTANRGSHYYSNIILRCLAQKFVLCVLSLSTKQIKMLDVVGTVKDGFMRTVWNCPMVIIPSLWGMKVWNGTAGVMTVTTLPSNLTMCTN